MSKKAKPIKNPVDSETFDDTQSEFTSDALDARAWTRALHYIDVSSSGTPTDVQIILQFSPDDGSTWFDYKKNYWGDFRYEDTATSSGLQECIDSMLAGTKFRYKVVATDTTATDTFTVDIQTELLFE